MGDAFRCKACLGDPERCTACRTRRATARNALRARRREAGKCTECGRKAVAGLSRCAAHRDDNNARSAASHIARRADED